jgi:hypothetical protein
MVENWIAEVKEKLRSAEAAGDPRAYRYASKSGNQQLVSYNYLQHRQSYNPT